MPLNPQLGQTHSWPTAITGFSGKSKLAIPTSLICECWNSALKFEQIKIHMGIVTSRDVTANELESTTQTPKLSKLSFENQSSAFCSWIFISESSFASRYRFYDIGRTYTIKLCTVTKLESGRLPPH